MESDPKQLWQGQKKEISTMTLERVRERARVLRAKTRRALLGWIALPLLIAGFGGWVVVKVNGGVEQQAAMGLALGWSLVGLYFAQRGMWSTASPEETGVRTGLESYRREVERRRLLPQRFLGWLFGPLLLAIVAFVAPLVSRGMIMRMIPFLSLVVLWIVAVFVMRALDQRELAREIDVLRELEKG